MPELPEVETIKRQLQKKVIDKIKNLDIKLKDVFRYFEAEKD